MPGQIIRTNYPRMGRIVQTDYIRGTEIATMDKRLPPELMRPLRFCDSNPKEGLRLIKAFLQIRDAAVRASLIELVETLAAAEQAKN
jgi:hypothetical protein